MLWKVGIVIILIIGYCTSVGVQNFKLLHLTRLGSWLDRCDKERKERGRNLLINRHGGGR